MIFTLKHRVGKKPGKFEKMGKTGKTAFFQNTYFKSMLNYSQKNNGMI
jgi:hypothetical protein